MSCACVGKVHACETVPNFIKRVLGFEAMCCWLVAEAISGVMA